MALEQSPYPIPVNENDRVNALHAYAILDTAEDPQFDAAARLAAEVLEAPMAAVGLVDNDRLWFKARVGIESPELDREIAMCAYAILRPDEMMVVEDLRNDSRFVHNPLVVGPPHLRFYAGAPLVHPKGYALGTLAVLDVKPRVVSSRQRQALSDLAALVMTVLEVHRRAVDLRQLATLDYLTGLKNRAQFELVLAGELRNAEREEKPMALLYLDLDHFKAINDRFGHAAGDEVLREVSHRLQGQVRAGDSLARIGGDEFAIVMRSGSDAGAAEVLAKRVVDALRVPVVIRGNPETIGASVGLALFPDNGEQMGDLMQRADDALYRAKRQLISG